MWNALHPIVIPALIASFVPSSRKNTYLGLLTFVGLVIAMLLQPISGALSDRWLSRFGRRRPLMVIGTALDVVFLLILGWAGGLAWIFFGYVGLQISSNTAEGPLQGLLRDRVPPHQLGVASSIKVFLDLASLVAASAIAGRLLKAGPGGASSIMLVVLGLVLVSGAITIVLSHEEPSRATKEVPTSVSGVGVSDANWPDHSYWWLIAERAAFLLGVYGLQAFGQYYLQDVLRVPNPPQQTGTLLSMVGAGTIVCVVAGGWLSDRFGSRLLLYAASGLTSAGMLLMLATADLRSSVCGGFARRRWDRLVPYIQLGARQQDCAVSTGREIPGADERGDGRCRGRGASAGSGRRPAQRVAARCLAGLPWHIRLRRAMYRGECFVPDQGQADRRAHPFRIDSPAIGGCNLA